MALAAFICRFRRLSGALVALAGVLVFAAPAMAQTGMVRGTVVDGDGKPIDGAVVVIEATEGVTRRHETKTNNRGEFIQIGLSSGNYSVTAQKEGIGAQTFPAQVRAGQTAEVNFQLVPGAQGVVMTREEAERLERLNEVFKEGVAASRGGDHAAAIEQFNKAVEIMPDCSDCYYNIGVAHSQLKQYEQAEAAFRKAVELRPDYVEAYSALASTYSQLKRPEDAAQASAEAARLATTGAAGAAGADAIFNQGVLLWNAGKISEAKVQFQEAVKLNPNHAEAQYWVGMANLNEGDLAAAVTAFEAYLKLAPDGQYADQARAIVSQLKQ